MAAKKKARGKTQAKKQAGKRKAAAKPARARKLQPRSIVVCSDGTGNTAIKGRGTNVFKVYEAIDTSGHRNDPMLNRQIAIYDDGVGTERLKLFRLVAGAFGLGLAAKVRHLYAEICRHYRPGDRLYFFGFSRGAFTVRTLAAMIAECGIIKRGEWDSDVKLKRKVKQAYNTRREKRPSLLARLRQWIRKGGPQPGAVDQFRKENAYDVPTDLRFVGVWDTVDAVGFPVPFVATVWNSLLYRFKFPDQRLNKAVKSAAHALSIDDARETFKPLLWDLDDDQQPERIDQVWFAGVHANVGGGYPKQGMSLTALDWMMAKAEAAGLRFIASIRDLYGRLPYADDKLYNSRAGWKALYRYRPRDIGRLCANTKVPVKVHISAIRRMCAGVDSYAPCSLPETLEVVATERKGQPPDVGEDPASLQQIGAWLRHELDARDGEFDGLKPLIELRRRVQYLAFGAPLLFLLGLVLLFAVSGFDVGIGDAFARLGVIGWTIVGVVALAACLGSWARRRMEAICSRFWLKTFEGRGKKPRPSGLDC